VKAWFWLLTATISCGMISCEKSNQPLSEDQTELQNNGNGHGNGHQVTVDQYEDFSDGAGYEDRWFNVSEFIGTEEPEVATSRAFAGGALNIDAAPFVTSTDHVLDHMKYLAVSTRSYEVPLRGSVEVAAEVVAQTPGAVHNRINPATNRRLALAQQGAATIALIDTGDTGIHLAWYIAQNRAFALYERTSPDGECRLDINFSQIVQEFAIPAGTNTFAIRYIRNTGAPGFNDKVGWLLNGQVRAEVRNVGIPLAANSRNHPITYPAQGPGEALDARLNRFNIAHGIATMVDEFPFNQCSTGQVSVPANQRAFGQGVNATWDNFRVTTVRM
jgi:hypothetical protein